jgi:hypothetical protein
MTKHSILDILYFLYAITFMIDEILIAIMCDKVITMSIVIKLLMFIIVSIMYLIGGSSYEKYDRIDT